MPAARKLPSDGWRCQVYSHTEEAIQPALGIPDSHIMVRGGWSDDRVLKAVYRHTMHNKE